MNLHDTSTLETFGWSPERKAPDPCESCASSALTDIQPDISTLAPELRRDMALCLRVLNHVPDAGGFACSLLEVPGRAPVWVLFDPLKGLCRPHPRDPADPKLDAAGLDRALHQAIVLAERFRKSDMALRLVVRFDALAERFGPGLYLYFRSDWAEAK